MRKRRTKLVPNACRPTDGPDGEVEYVWTVPDGRGIVHSHGPDGCPFEPGGKLAGQVDQVLRSMGDQPCSSCGRHHDGPHR